MNGIVEYLKTYIDDNVRIKDVSVDISNTLNLMLSNSFVFYHVEILNTSFLLLKPKTEMTYMQLKTRMNQIENKCDIYVAVCLKDATNYMMKKMLMEKTAFLIVEKQLYLPFLAMAIKTKKDRYTIKNIQKFTPGTQLLFLYMLYADANEFSASVLIETLHLSAMTVSRGLADLCGIGLLTFEESGKTRRKKLYHCIDKKEFYNQGKKHLIDPIKGSVYVRDIVKIKPLVKSSFSALSTLTMLSEQKQQYYALYEKDKTLISHFIVSDEEGMIENFPIVQLMKYDVCLLSEKNCIDPISLMLSITSDDERIQISIEELMKKYNWYEGEDEKW